MILALVVSTAGKFRPNTRTPTRQGVPIIGPSPSMPLFAVRNQIGIWKAYENRVWLPFGGISAMPSLHIAIAVIFALAG